MRTLPVSLRYGAVAGLCAVAHNIIMILGNWMGIATPLLVMLSFCAVILLGFGLHTRVTFAVGPDLESLVRYTMAMAANLPLTMVILWFLVEVCGWSMVVAAPAGTIVLVALNFLMTQWAIVSRLRGKA